MDCPTDNAFTAAVAGRLSAQERKNFERHIDSCAACRQHHSELCRIEPATRERYLMGEQIGQGATGIVYRASDTTLNRNVAIKVITVPYLAAELRKQVLQEARTLARLEHKGIVKIYDLHEVDGQLWLVSELVEGVDLSKLLAQETQMAWRKALQIGIEISSALAAAHRQGVIHRDIKTSNIMRSRKAEIKLIDFGLAKLWEPAEVLLASTSSVAAQEPPRSLTHTGFVGTHGYAAPEVYRGEPTPRSDIYSVGAVLYELCTGRLPHQEKEKEALGRAVQEQDAVTLATVVPKINRKFAAVVDRCLRREPEERYQSSQELHDALDTVDAIQLPHLPPLSPWVQHFLTCCAGGMCAWAVWLFLRGPVEHGPLSSEQSQRPIQELQELFLKNGGEISTEGLDRLFKLVKQVPEPVAIGAIDTFMTRFETSRPVRIFAGSAPLKTSAFASDNRTVQLWDEKNMAFVLDVGKKAVARAEFNQVARNFEEKIKKEECTDVPFCVTQDGYDVSIWQRRVKDLVLLHHFTDGFRVKKVMAISDDGSRVLPRRLIDGGPSRLVDGHRSQGRGAAEAGWTLWQWKAGATRWQDISR